MGPLRALLLLPRALAPGRVPPSVVVMVALTVALGGCDRPAAGDSGAVVVGSGSTVEQQLLSALAADLLEEGGFAVEVRMVEGGTVALRRDAIRGHIDVFWDYTGAAWALGLGEHAPPADPQESYERVSRADEGSGLVWLAPTAANATLALFVRSDEPRDLTWLAGVLSSGDERLCADPDFISRPGGLDALAAADAYAIDLGRLDVVAGEEDEAIEGVAEGRCFAGLATATSGAARLAGLQPVADDLTIFPAFIIAPVVREAALETHPRLAAVIERLAPAIDTATLAALNAEVEAGVDPGDVAAAYLEENLRP
jgi:osmoprotectant transport system substrate-binding protein